jgi:phosphomevalonate kinase
VIATDSRFYTHVTPAQDAQEGRQLVRVRSPQFIGARWDYVVAVKQDTCSLQQTRCAAEALKQHLSITDSQPGSETHAAANAGPNPFISLAVLYALRLAVEVRGSEHVASVLAPHGLDIAVLADNDFYSQRQGVSRVDCDAAAAMLTLLHRPRHHHATSWRPCRRSTRKSVPFATCTRRGSAAVQP